LATGALLGLFGEARDGLKAIARFAGLWALLGASAAALFFAGLVNVAELPFITGDLDAGDSVYSATVALAGAGIVMGSLAGGAGGTLAVLRRRYLIGLGVMGMGALLSGLAPSWQIILVTFALGGFGNGLMLIHERLIIQATVPDHLTARVFGVKDALSAWSFGLAFVAAGALISAFDTRPVLILAGVGTVAVGGVAILTLRIADSVAVGAPAAGEPGPRSAEL
jgi:MFS family permease